MGGSDAEIYEKYAEELTRFATGIVGPFEAPDVVSGAVLRCLMSKGWRRADNQRAYLYRAVLNEALALRRATLRRRRREALFASPFVPASDDVDEAVLAAVGRLSVRQRAVIVLTYWNDLDPLAIASLLGVGEGTVRRHLARAREHLREYLHERN
ncbi:MAG: RNA polymerase sigma factor [Acidimicrobiales bacterium]